MANTVKMRDVHFDKKLFENYCTQTTLDEMLCSYQGLPKGVNYMVIGDPGVGKTTVILDMLANIRQANPGVRVLFISAEMNEIDLAIYVNRYPKFADLDILFIENDPTEESRSWRSIVETLEEGWDIVAIDSFSELAGIIKEEELVSHHRAETMLLSLIKQHNKSQNNRCINTSFLTIQQVTKKGAFVGTNRLKHMITAMMELRLDNPKNSFSGRYITFSKHRRGDVGTKLYYSLMATGDVEYNSERYEQDQEVRRMQREVHQQLHDFADKFDQVFNAVNKSAYGE